MNAHGGGPIEVERRAIVDKDTYDTLLRSLANDPRYRDEGPNDTRSVFFLASDWQIKVQHAISRGTAKLAWKSGGNDGSSAREEIEVSFEPSNMQQMEDVVAKLAGNAQKFDTFQRRHDFTLLHTDVGIAVKCSDDWGYHVELDMQVDADVDTDSVEDVLRSVAQDLAIDLLSPEQEIAHVQERIAIRQQ